MVVTLPAEATTPRAARQFLADTLGRWQVTSAVVDLATLLTSELVTNAVRHAGGAVRITIDCETERGLTVEVHDSSPVLPSPRRPAEDDESGYGLLLVDALSTWWSAHVDPDRRRKTVWFTLQPRAA